MAALFIGLMSGTSMDGIDAVLVDLATEQPTLLATHCEPLPEDLQQALHALCQPGEDELNRLAEADVLTGRAFAKAALSLLKKTDITAKDIMAIGSHGQTVRHAPNGHIPFTVQIGDPNVIATLTGITTIADFRRRDIAAGGQGAPFAPAFHEHLLRDKVTDRIILNIGGIANVTVLPADQSQPVRGFDTGPGNTLMDQWYRQHTDKAFDHSGAWAATGKVDEALLSTLLADPYFQQAPPKSSGRETFHMDWLQKKAHTMKKDLAPESIQATLVEFTAKSIVQAAKQFGPKKAEVFVCGGGTHNTLLMQRLRDLGLDYSIKSIEELGYDPDWIEAMAFAWFAQKTLRNEPVDLTQITGSNKPIVLGGIYA